MTRIVFGEALFFLLPFAVFAAYLLLRRQNPFARAAWSREAVWLALAGFACVIVALVYTGLTSERRLGPYQPTHMEDGRLVPGQFR